MTFDQARTQFAVYLGAQETTIDAIISGADRDALINEAYIETEATYGSSVYGPTPPPGIAFSTPIVSLGATLASAPVHQIEACEVGTVSAGLSTPLVRASLGSILKLNGTEGAVGFPRQWGASLSSRNQLTGVSTFRVGFYPGPDTTYYAYFFLRLIVPDLVLGTDLFQLDDVQSDYAIRVAAYRAAYTLGYDDAFLRELVSNLPDAYQMMMHIDHRTRYSAPEGLARKFGEDARAV